MVAYAGKIFVGLYMINCILQLSVKLGQMLIVCHWQMKNQCYSELFLWWDTFQYFLKGDGVVKTLHLVRCYNFSIITTYRMYAEMIEKLYASNMKFFTYPSKLRFLRVCQRVMVS